MYMTAVQLQPVAPVVYFSGSPRMLLVLVREFESRRGEISIYLEK